MAPLHAIRKDGFKWIRAPRPELYDLRADPGELTNLHPSRTRARGDRARTSIRSWTRCCRRRGSAPQPRAESDDARDDGDAAVARLSRARRGAAQHGGRRSEGRHRDLQPPRRGAPSRAGARLAEGGSDRARDPRPTLPDHVAARNVLGLAQVRQRKYDEARETYQRSLQTEPDQFRIHANLGSLALRERDLDTSEKDSRSRWSMNPRFVEAMLNLGLIASLRGDQRRRGAAGIARPKQAHPGFRRQRAASAISYYEQGRLQRGARALRARAAVARRRCSRRWCRPATARAASAIRRSAARLLRRGGDAARGFVGPLVQPRLPARHARRRRRGVPRARREPASRHRRSVAAAHRPGPRRRCGAIAASPG